MSEPAAGSQYLPELERVATTAAPEDIPAILGDLERLRARLWLRMNEASVPPAAVPREEKADRLLTVAEAAEILGVKPRWLYAHADEIPGMQRLSPRCLRFSERKLGRWMARRST